MNYIIIPAYDEQDHLLDVLERLGAAGVSDYHVVSDASTPPILPTEPTTVSLDEQLVFEINRELAMATATACYHRAVAQWGDEAAQRRAIENGLEVPT